MLSYKSSMLNSQKYLNQDIPTATKTNYIDSSPSQVNISTPKIRSPNKYDNKVRDVKNQISLIINEVANKSNVNRGALQSIIQLNNDAATYFKDGGHRRMNDKNYGYQNGANQHNNFSPNYGLSNKDNNFSQYNTNKNNKNGNNFMNNPEMSLEQQNLMLRKALNQQVRENNEMLRRINDLQQQNCHLRSQLGLPLRNFGYKNGNDLRSTAGYSDLPMNNQIHDRQMGSSNSINYPHNQYMHNQHMQRDPNQKFGGRRAQQNLYNQTMPNEYSRQMNNDKYMNRNQPYSNWQPSSLFKQLQAIKDYDEELRQKTLKLLKN